MQGASRIERKIVRELLTRIFRQGWSISVHDGLAWPVERTTDRDDVLDTIGAGPEDTLVFFDKTGGRQGQLTLSWGMDLDLITDISDDSDVLSRIYVAVQEAVEQELTREWRTPRHAVRAWR